MQRIENIFLDRDGTLVKDPGYLHKPEDVELLPGVAESLARFKRAGAGLYVVTNQSGIGRGYYGPEDFFAVQQRIDELLAPFGVNFNQVCYCPHGPDEGCACRKPATGMWSVLSSTCGLGPCGCAMVGDNASDVEFGLSCGFYPVVLILTGLGEKYAAKLELPQLDGRPYLELEPARPGWPHLLAQDLSATADYFFAKGLLKE